MTQINSSFGRGGMSIALNEIQFSALIQHLKNESANKLPIKKAACVIGLQPCGNVWVLGEDIQICYTTSVG